MLNKTPDSSHLPAEASSLHRAAGDSLPPCEEDSDEDGGADTESFGKLPAEERHFLENDKNHSVSEAKDAQVNSNDKKKKEGNDDEAALLQDRGWAWFVVLGCFISHIVIGGFERADGVLFMEFTERFHESAQLTAWPGSLCSSIRLMSGPLATAVSNRFSVRASVMAGTFIFALGVALSGLAPNIPYLFFTYGILQGFGRGLVYAPGIVMVGLYFNRRRSLGTGLGTAGVGAGTFLLPPLVEILFAEFGFSGGFLILAGIALNLCIVAALFRPLSIHRSIVIGERKKSAGQVVEEQPFIITSKESPPGCPSKSLHNAEPTVVIELNIVDHANSVPDKGRPAANFQGKLQSERKSQIWSCFRCIFTSCFPVEEDKKGQKKRELIEWSLLKEPQFLFYCLSISLFTAAFKSAFTFLPALASSSGVSKLEGAYLLSISGILDTVGRVLAGLILDLQCIKAFRPLVYNGVIFVIVVLSFLAPFMTTFAELALLFGLYGMMTGTYVSQKSVVIVDILGKEKLSSSFGLLILFQGLGGLVGPPLSGLLRDIYGSFKEAFFMGGGAMAVAGGLMIISNAYRIVYERRTRQASTEEA